ncbi:ribosomal RNA-processing protein 1 [Phytophthora pseudosyringae]|uniref:Ribosomal RNA-processing protein 1 n=1 Tax=Phytophthora pseudosyringae TaxID=221518 RepID=A0A8T1VQ25_9STRA|nr:ribosomal RNA-processing protein 1 [Phytophthora pseudosyringae]
MENAASRFGQHLAHTGTSILAHDSASFCCRNARPKSPELLRHSHVLQKKYRDRALKKLTVYLTKKTEWTDLEWDKLWKALFYCMWMSDKRPVQEELATNLAALVHRIPSPGAALEFVHSFFRTMHREWHGLDGLRLDKFYSLVRKFVRETVALLHVQEWDEDLVQQFVTILSAEVVSQVPNGLRMHLADLYLAEIYSAAGKDVTTEAFMTLLEPFFTLLSSEYDKTVFKRVRELVFEGMLAQYKFGPQPVKAEEAEETDEEEEEEEDKVFEQVDVAQVQHRIFAIASADDTAERNRSALYTLYKKFFTVTHVDSFQAAQEEAAKPKKSAKKEKKVKKMEEEKPEPAKEEDGEKKNKKSKKRKAKKEVEVEAKVKKVEEASEKKVESPSKRNAKKLKVATKTQAEDIKMATLSAETEKSKKKQQKKKQEEKVVEKKLAETKAVEKKPAAPAKENTPTKGQLKSNQEKAEKKKESYTTVSKSGKKFKRCGSCGGFGKGLVPKDKALCGHCERAQKTQKKKSASASKKRKAEVQAQAAREEQENAESGKKVTFGKSKALRHEVSVKRLRASAKRDAVSKDTEDIKGVLKVGTPSPVATKKSKKTKATKGRKKAADFM